jgi:hypothetical protein
MRYLIVVAAAAQLIAGCTGIAKLPTGNLATANCTAADSDARGTLGPEWHAFLRYVDTCDVKDADRRTVMRVLSVSASRYYAGLPDGVETVTFPKPILVTPAGHMVGRLPLNFPDDPPLVLHVTFVDWAEAWPRRIEMFVQDPTATGDHALPPLIWDASGNRFVQGGPHD